MSRQSAKNELAELVASPSEKKIRGVIYAYNKRYKIHDMVNKQRHSIDTVSETKVKTLSKDRQYPIMFFNPSGKNAPAWINKVCSCVIPVDHCQEDLLKEFFDYNFPSKEFASPKEYYARHGMSENEERLYHGVTDLWARYIKALAIERGLH